jgi:radical SAM superfamily enzyme YgiQ (UPF0313 family)
MRVLLIQPPLADFYTTPIRFYPLGLLYAAKVLEEADVSVALLDCLSPLKKKKIPVPQDFSYLPPLGEVSHFFKGYYRFGIGEAEIVSRIRAFAPDLIGISSQFTAYYQSVAGLAALIKRNFCVPIFVGGNHATIFAPQIRRRSPEIDFVLEGPAEECLPEFINRIGPRPEAAKVDWRKIRPSHHLLRGEDYRIGRKNYISLTASRGCPFGCDFCSVHRMFGREIRYREIDDVLGEMRANHTAKETRLFNFEDDNLSFDRSWFLNFLKSVESDPELPGSELTAMNGLCYATLDEEVLEAMKRAGFREINLSLVTQSAELRNQFRRPYLIDSFDKFNKLIRAAQRLSFFVTVYVILGLPGQTYTEVKESIDYLLGLGVLVGPSVFYPAPGSRLFEEIPLSPAVKKNWNLYRSSAFAVETPDLSRGQLLELFSYVRQRNLERRGHERRNRRFETRPVVS